MSTKLNDLSGKEWLRHSFSIWRDVRKNPEEKKMGHPAMFPVELASRLIDVFTRENDVVLDPFLGSGSTAVASMQKNRNFIGIELSKKYVDLASSRIEQCIRQNNASAKPEIFCHDSTKLSGIIKTQKIDFCLTSPPYWNILNQKRTADNKKIRNYGATKNDLGNINDYDAFLNQIRVVFSQVHTLLNNNKYCVIVVMDVRKKNEFFPLHIDIINVMKNIGFLFDDLIIWDRQSEYNNMRPLGYPSVFRVNKVHEFILIFKKVSP